jgi:chromate reductase, NAD(P)H dehydrogenase (quinone)
MAREEVRVLVIAGSARRESLNAKLARLAAEALVRAGAQVDPAGLREFEVPLYDGDLEAEQGIPAGALALRDRLHAAGALCLVTPEYNHSIPGTVKNLVDWLSRIRPNAMRGIPALVMSASPSLAGGTRGAWALKVPLEANGMFVLPRIFSVSQARKAFADDGSLREAELAARLDAIAGDFVAFARAVGPVVPVRPFLAG